MRLINLLPKKRQEEIFYENILNGLFMVIWISLGSFVLVFLIQFGAKIYLESRLNSIVYKREELKQQVNKEENAEIKAKITAINNKIDDYKNLADSSPRWSNVLKAFSVLPPEGVKITSFNVNPVSKSITIRGEALTRELVIELYNVINADKNNFYNIDYPLENLVRPTKVNFHYTFFIKDKLLK